MNNIILTSCGIRNSEFKDRFYQLLPKDELKRKEVDKVLSKALLDFDFDSGDENKESEEF